MTDSKSSKIVETEDNLSSFSKSSEIVKTEDNLLGDKRTLFWLFRLVYRGFTVGNGDFLVTR